jgi:hypothetical protein
MYIPTFYEDYATPLVPVLCMMMGATKKRDFIQEVQLSEEKRLLSAKCLNH